MGRFLSTHLSTLGLFHIKCLPLHSWRGGKKQTAKKKNKESPKKKIKYFTKYVFHSTDGGKINKGSPKKSSISHNMSSIPPMEEKKNKGSPKESNISRNVFHSTHVEKYKDGLRNRILTATQKRFSKYPAVIILH